LINHDLPKKGLAQSRKVAKEKSARREALSFRVLHFRVFRIFRGSSHFLVPAEGYAAFHPWLLENSKMISESGNVIYVRNPKPEIGRTRLRLAAKRNLFII